MREIVAGVVRYRDLVAKIKIAKFFPGVLVIREKFVLGTLGCCVGVCRAMALIGDAGKP